MRICICDDLKSDLLALETLCREYLRERGLDVELVCTQDPNVPVEEPFDLLILDIEMPELSGIDVKNSLFGRERPLILFATSYEENMKEAFGPNVIGFMNKPVDQEDFSFYVDQVMRLLSAGKMVELEKGEMISTEQIVMFTTEEKYTVAILAGERKTVLIDKSLSAWEEELSDVFFIRTSSSYLINCKYIRDFSGDRILLASGETVKASKRKKAECFERFIEYRRRYQRFA